MNKGDKMVCIRTKGIWVSLHTKSLTTNGPNYNEVVTCDGEKNNTAYYVREYLYHVKGPKQSFGKQYFVPVIDAAISIELTTEVSVPEKVDVPTRILEPDE